MHNALSFIIFATAAIIGLWALYVTITEAWEGNENG